MHDTTACLHAHEILSFDYQAMGVRETENAALDGRIVQLEQDASVLIERVTNLQACTLVLL